MSRRRSRETYPKRRHSETLDVDWNDNLDGLESCVQQFGKDLDFDFDIGFDIDFHIDIYFLFDFGIFFLSVVLFDLIVFDFCLLCLIFLIQLQ